MIECIKFREHKQSTLLGFADIFVEKWGMEIYGITLHFKEGKKWINFPSRQYEKEGEKKHAPYFRFRLESHYKKFCEMVIDAIEKKIKETEPQGDFYDTDDSPICF